MFLKNSHIDTYAFTLDQTNLLNAHDLLTAFVCKENVIELES